MASIEIPFNRPCRVGTEKERVLAVLDSDHISGDGPFTRACSKLLEEALGVPKVLLTTSCTHALEICGLLLDLGPDDEVIVPSYTFVSTANAFALRKARLVFSDVRADTMNMDEQRLEALITPRTKAIVPVHYAGVSCEMDEINAVAKKHGICVIEDNAHGLFGAYRGRPLGTLGALATQSFHETKNFTCGEGGALLINDLSYAQRAEIIREKGTDRSRFFRGEVDKYTWQDYGSSYLPAEVVSAYLMAQLESREPVQAARKVIYDRYDSELSDWAKERGIQTPFVPDYCDSAYHMYFLVLPNLEQRTRFIQHLRDQGILAVFHYQPLHLSAFGQRMGGKAGDCPVTEDICDRLVRLPFYFQLSESEQAKVIDAVKRFDVE